MEPLALLAALCKALDERAREVERAEEWYEGDHPIPLPPPNTAAASQREARIAFETMARLGVTNFIPPIVDVPAASLRVEGFRFAGSPVSSDAEAWTIWQRNFMDADSDLAIKTALKTGQAFALVWADADGLATITVEDPEQCIVMYEAGSRRKRKAGLKRWTDETGGVCATLYTAEAVYKFRQTRNDSTGKVEWLPREIDGEAWPLPNPYGFVPLVELRANPELKASLFGGGEPEFAKQVNEQRKINQTVLNLLVTMDHQSFRQRWVTGWGAPTKPDGTPDADQVKKASAALLWTFEDPDVKVGEFSQADLRPFLEVVTAWVKVIASTSGTPPYAFLLGDMINVAADSLARIEGIKAGKVKAHARNFGESFAEIIRAALAVEGNPKASDTAAAVVWAEFEERTATEQAALAVTMRDLGAPKEVTFSTLPGVSQAEAARWVTSSLADDLRAAALLPVVPPAAPVAAPAPNGP